MRFARLLWHRRSPGWLLFALLLAGLGYGLHEWLPPDPRWTLDGPLRPIGFSANGALLLNASFVDAAEPPAPRGRVPIHVWDVAHGRELHRVFEGAERLEDCKRSDDCRWLVALELTDQGHFTLRCADLVGGKTANFPLGPGKRGTFSIAPKGALIAVELGDDWGPGLRRLLLGADGLRLLAEFKATQWRWSADGQKALVLHMAGPNAWHFQTITSAHVQGNTYPLAGEWIDLSPNDRFVLTHKSGEPFNKLVVSDAKTGQRLGEMHDDALSPLEPLMYSPDGSHAFLSGGGEDRKARVAAFWDLQTCQKHGVLPLRGDEWGFAHHTPDGRSLLLRSWPGDNLDAYEVPSARLLWRRQWLTGELRKFSVSDRCAAVVVELGTPDLERLELLDDKTGGTIRTLALNLNQGDYWSLHERHLVVHERPPIAQGAVWDLLESWGVPVRGRRVVHVIRVIEATTGRQVIQQEIGYTAEAQLSPDGKSLIVVRTRTEPEDTTPAITCYDVPARKPLRWVLGVPAALGLALVLVRYGWRRWHTPKAVAARGAFSA